MPEEQPDNSPLLTAEQRPSEQHKKMVCQNCDTVLPNHENFCPNCGQKNMASKVTVWELLNEAVESYLNLDSRFFRSLPIFLFSPGKLTVEFMDGKRKQYLHPVRFYFIVSLAFFFIFNKLVVGGQSNIFDISIDLPLDTPSAISSEMTEALQKAQQEGSLTEDDAKAMKRLMANIDQQYVANQYLDTAKLELDNFTLFGTEFNFSAEKFYHVWIRQPGMTTEALLDSMNAKNVNWITYRFAEQSIKLGKEKPSYFSNEILENIPVMVFLLIPVVALLLRLLYIRRKRFYLEHLIFTFHLFSFLFILFGSMFLVLHFLADSEAVAITAMVIAVAYSYLSLLRVYQQGYIKTFLKMCLIGNTYLIILAFATVLEVVVSLLLA